MQKLELTWIGKGEEPQVEPRILLHDASKDYGDPNATNILIHGDNLLALKALEQDFAGQVKCIYIDPPYNTGSAFEHYDDNLEHSTWLSLMYPRLEILRNLLSDDGFFCCHIDDSEGHYLKVMLDEIFGRQKPLGIKDTFTAEKISADALASAVTLPLSLRHYARLTEHRSSVRHPCRTARYKRNTHPPAGSPSPALSQP